jgi:hypothetical protein
MYNVTLACARARCSDAEVLLAAAPDRLGRGIISLCRLRRPRASNVPPAPFARQASVSCIFLLRGSRRCSLPRGLLPSPL